MNIEKAKLCALMGCYAAGTLVLNGRLKYLFAAEDDNPCYAFDALTGERSTVWEHPGGTMSTIPLPDTNGEFLAVQGFRPRFMAHNTSIAWVRPKNGGWDVKTIIRHPFVHRFDIFQSGEQTHILLCTLATSKSDPDDWSNPGKLWAGVLPKDLNSGSPKGREAFWGGNESFEIKPIKEGLLKNHGYCRVNWNGKEAGMTSSEDGVFVATPPQSSGGEWSVEQIMRRPVSDIAVADIDGDGQIEIATIEPFHGRGFTINKNTSSGWEPVYTYEGDFDFGHVVWGGSLRGVPTFIGGARSGARELFYVQCDSASPLTFRTALIDRGQGPSNIAVANGAGSDVILAANREVNEAAVYTVTD